ncbi:hypothetical protein FMM75_04295 [Lachnospiraceae bacterium MD335]|nr:hypothetical protein [Lachnospiraceae bacterium MD335]
MLLHSALYIFSLSSHQQIANYSKTAAICIKPFVDQYPYRRTHRFFPLFLKSADRLRRYLQQTVFYI